MSSVVVRLHTHVWNPAGARRALLLHGLGSDGATLWRLADHLAQLGFAVTAPDLRGQGLSPPAASYALTDLAADVRLLGSGWDLLAGHSLGGAIAGVLLAEPGFAESAVLLDPVLVVAESSKPELTAAFVAELGGALTEARVRAEEPAWAEEDVYRLVRASRLLSPAVVRRILADTSPWDLIETARQWTVPVTILAADPAISQLFSPEHARRVQEASAHVRVVTVAKAGHSVHRDAPETVLAAIDHALAEL